MIKKGIILSLFVICLMFPVYIYAYTGGTNAYYVELITSELGAITVYIPINYAECFTIENNKIINQTQSNITGYISGINGTIRFSPFTSNPQYQNNYQWIDLTITSINDYNLPTLRKTDFLSVSISKISPYIYMFMFLVIICLMFTRL